MFKEEELNEKIIIFIDEAHFWLNGYVNKQNYRCWGSEKPQILKVKSFNLVKRQYGRQYQ